MAGFGGIRKGRKEAADNLSIQEEGIVPVVVVRVNHRPWRVILFAADARTSGQIQITFLVKSVATAESPP